MASYELRRYQCDCCQGTAEVTPYGEDDAGKQLYRLPNGWFSVAINGPVIPPPRVFCSLQHMASYLAQWCTEEACSPWNRK